MGEHVWRIIIVAGIIFFINLPFGALRANVKKYSIKWFLYIHLPIPVVVFLRIYSEIGFAFYTYPILLGAFFTGQLLGKKYLSKYFKKVQPEIINNK